MIKPKLNNISLGPCRQRGHQLCLFGMKDNVTEKVPITCIESAKFLREVDWDLNRNRILGYRIIQRDHTHDESKLDIVSSIKQCPKWIQSIWRYHN